MLLIVIALGYLMAGFSNLLIESGQKPIDRIGLMINPTITSYAILLLAWPWTIFVKQYYFHMPNKPMGWLYGTLTVIGIWVSSSLFMFLATYPATQIDNMLLSIAITIIIFIIGIMFIFPLINIITAFFVSMIASPFALIFKKKH